MYKTLEQKFEEINQMLPEHDFVACFGTSHTSGACERPNQGIEIPLENYWCNNIGKPAYNFGLVGNNNDTLVQQVSEFLQLERSKHCSQIIVEARLGETVTRASMDTLGDLELIGRKNYNIALSSHFESKELRHEKYGWNLYPMRDTVHDGLLLRLPISLIKGKDRITDYANSCFPSDENPVNKTIHRSIKRIIETYHDEVAHTVLEAVLDLQNIKTMEAMCKIAGKKFMWFHWDNNALHNDRNDDWLHVKRCFDQISDIWRNEVPGLHGGVCYEFQKTLTDGLTLDDFTCDCGHQTEPVHDFVAEKIKEVL
jgi:hypothetical protein